jgi:CoA:oxalate CoA-transferase
MQQPLDGIKVLDLSHALAGAACTNILGRFGAEIIKVERPGEGDDLRHFTEAPGLEGMSISFSSVNAGKRSVVLDLKNPAAREVFERLVKRSDILVENFRPGVTKSLGADWESVRQINPRLVYCSITGFGQTGGMRLRTAYDHIIQAVSGLMWANGGADGPRRLGMPAIDTFSGYFAAVGVLAALRRRDATGRGEFLDVGMLDAAVTMVSAAAATAVRTGKENPPTTDRAWRVVPTAGIYQTADGYMDIGANQQHQVERLFDVLGRPELKQDPRFKDHAARLKTGEALFELLKAELLKRRSDDLERDLNAVNVPAATVRTIGQIAAHPQTSERRMWVNATAHGQPLAIMRGAPLLEGAGDEAGEVPSVGQHSDEVLGELGYDPAGIEALRAQGVI